MRIGHGFDAHKFSDEGQLILGGVTIPEAPAMLAHSDGDVLIQGEGRGLLLSSPPLNEPIARHGPFVLATEDELKTAFIDYQIGRLAPNQAAFLASGGRG